MNFCIGMRPLAACIVSCACSALQAQPRAVELDPTERIRIDGRLEEAVWQRAPQQADFVQYLPLDRRPPPTGYRTTLQVVAEPDALVIGIRAHDPDPAQIRAPLVRRDEVRRDQDFVAVYIDAVGDRRSAQFVRVNAAGVVADGVYVAASDNEDFAPDFDVEAAVQRLPDGYSIELRLPLITLRYPAAGAPWRMMVARSVPRASSVLLLSAPLAKDGLSFIAELQRIDGLEALIERSRTHSLLILRPELTLRAGRVRGAAADPTAAASRRSSAAALGAELKWRPSAEWVLDATLNPDFSQVDLDVPQLAGNTRFALSVPEKRAFFLESTDVIDLPLAAFYSRSVADPRYGLRATWRAPRGDATAWTLSDGPGGLLLRPGAFATDVALQEGRSQASLLRGRMHVGAGLSLGGLWSRRDHGAGRGTNDVVGADGVWQPTAQDQLRLRALASRTDALFDRLGRLQAGPPEQGHWLEARWNRRSEGWIANLIATEVSPRFRNDNGFVDQAGIRKVEAEVIRRWGSQRLSALGPWAFDAHEFETYSWLQHTGALVDRAGGVAEAQTVSRRWHPGIWFAGPMNADGWVQLEIDAERTRTGGRLHPTRRVGAEVGVNPAPWFTRATAKLVAGERVDVEADRVGRGAELLLEAKLRGSGWGWGLESEQRVQHGYVDHAGRRALTDTAAQWLGVVHLSARDSVRAVWQRSRYTRMADLSAGLSEQGQDRRTVSLVFQHRVGIGRSVAVGASTQREDPRGQRREELFFKAALAL